jgi:DNA-binding NarL/FixJ family response regulator
MEIRLLIADDHPIFLKGLKEVIEMDDGLKVIVSAKNGQEALLSFQSHSVDVVVLDIDMPRMTGLEAAEKMLLIQPDLLIIILTMHKEKAPFLKALEIGVLGYVLKRKRRFGHCACYLQGQRRRPLPESRNIGLSSQKDIDPATTIEKRPESVAYPFGNAHHEIDLRIQIQQGNRRCAFH